MNIVTMQSFDDNLMQKSWDEINYWNSCRNREADERTTEDDLKRWDKYFNERKTNLYVQESCLSHLEAIKGAILELEEAADKFWVSYYWMPEVKYHHSNSFSQNRKWENREFIGNCAERAQNAADRLKKIIALKKDG